MFKYDGSRIVINSNLRKIITDLVNEPYYSGEDQDDIDIVPSVQRYYTFRRKKKY